MEWMLMPLKRYADFSGRSRRMEFWMWQLFKFAVVFGVMILMMILGGAALMGASDGGPHAVMAAGGVVLILYLLLLLFGLAIIIPDIAVTVRRLHDTDRSGWWILAPVAPYIVVFLAAGFAGSFARIGGVAGGLGGLAAGHGGPRRNDRIRRTARHHRPGDHAACLLLHGGHAGTQSLRPRSQGRQHRRGFRLSPEAARAGRLPPARRRPR